MLPAEPTTPPNSLVWRIIHFPLVLLVLGALTLIAAMQLTSAIRPLFPVVGVSPMAVMVALIVSGILVAAYVLFVRWIERRRVTELSVRNWYGETGIGLILGFGLFSLVIVIIAGFGGYRVRGVNSPTLIYPAIALAITSGVLEEILFRGLFFRLVERLVGSWGALVLSAVLFGAAHIFNPGATWFSSVAIALEAGVMLAALYMVTQRLWAAIGLHAMWNLTQGGIFGVPVSGYDLPGLLAPRIVGPDLLTGGAFGAEASLPALIVCTAFGIALLVVAHRRGRFVAPMWRRQGAGLQE